MELQDKLRKAIVPSELLLKGKRRLRILKQDSRDEASALILSARIKLAKAYNKFLSLMLLTIDESKIDSEVMIQLNIVFGEIQRVVRDLRELLD